MIHMSFLKNTMMEHFISKPSLNKSTIVVVYCRYGMETVTVIKNGVCVVWCGWDVVCE